MAAAMIATQHWASEDPRSLKFPSKEVPNKSKCVIGERTKRKSNDDGSKTSKSFDNPKRLKNSRTSENVNRSKIKIAKGVSRVKSLAIAKVRKVETPKDPTRVKPSALLYEITERTNQLAQPRTRKIEANYMQPRPVLSRIPEPSKRILELSQPKVPYTRQSDTYGDVAPAALRAIATKRIIELSKPRKKRRPKVAKKKEAIYAPCSPRIVYLSRPKRVTNTNKRSEKLVRQLLELTTGKKQRREKRRRLKKKRGAARRTRSSNSNRTVITIDLSGSESKGSRRPKLTARRKSKRSKAGN